ncbi:MAG: hypothetical protein HDQ97_19040 [Lachnospiraceae bacterium]|nr:hypothetical protein [Lachnospiraceae bacterium]
MYEPPVDYIGRYREDPELLEQRKMELKFLRRTWVLLNNEVKIHTNNHSVYFYLTRVIFVQGIMFKIRNYNGEISESSFSGESWEVQYGVSKHEYFYIWKRGFTGRFGTFSKAKFPFDFYKEIIGNYSRIVDEKIIC